MSKIIQLSPHVANLIAAGEVVERPASVVKELLENAVDAGATKITVEIRNGGMTFIRVSDNGCGMSAEDARTAFLRHATSKLRKAEDLAAISTMGFRGEALAAIASVSRIDIMTKEAGSTYGTSLSLEAGNITEESEAGCPEGTTIIVRDLFFNTPARMKFMKADTIEGGKVAAAVQLQALAHSDISFRLLRDGKQILSTPGNGGLETAVYCVYGRNCANMIKVSSQWESFHLTGFVSKPTDARPSRNLQTFFVNGRPIKSKLLVAALEEAYRNQIMLGKFPTCVLHLTVPANVVDVNVHPAKTEVKFLNEKAVFDCIHYGVLGALNSTSDRPDLHFKATPVITPAQSSRPKQNTFFRTMNTAEYQAFSAAMKDAPRPTETAAAATIAAVERTMQSALHEPVIVPKSDVQILEETTASAFMQLSGSEPEQEVLPMPEETPWRIVGELFRTYIVIEQGDDTFLIDKHAAHERILFNKLKSRQEAFNSQALLTPLPCYLSAENSAILLENRPLLEELGFEIEEFGVNTVLIRQIPMDLSEDDALTTLEEISSDLLKGRTESKDNIRDEVLHTVACKAAIKAGWSTDDQELLFLASEVMADESLKHCPHGRPICICLNKKHLEKQFKRT